MRQLLSCLLLLKEAVVYRVVCHVSVAVVPLASASLLRFLTDAVIFCLTEGWVERPCGRARRRMRVNKRPSYHLSPFHFTESSYVPHRTEK